MGCRGIKKVKRYVSTGGLGMEYADDCPGCDDCRINMPVPSGTPRITVPSDLSDWQEAIHGTLGFQWEAPNTGEVSVRIVATSTGHAVLYVERDHGCSLFEVAFTDMSGEASCRQLAERVMQSAVGCGVVRHRVGGL